MAFIGNTNTTQAFTPAVDYFSGNGSTTAFTLSRPVASVAQVEAVIDNVVQNPSSAYTVSSNTITFTSAPLSGTNNIYVRYTSPITQVIAPGQGTVDATSLASSTGSGAVVLATSPTIANPTLTTPNIDSAQFATVSGSAPIYPCRAWVNFNGSGTIAIRASGNVSSLTDNGVGDYTVNFTNAMPDANFSVGGSYNTGNSIPSRGTTSIGLNTTATGSVRVWTGYGSTTSSNGALEDPSTVCVNVFR